MLLKIAIRNIFRNKRRTALTVLALSSGLCLTIAAFGLTRGWMDKLEVLATNTNIGHIQIHAKEYLDDLDMYKNISKPEAIMKKINALPNISSSSARLFSFGIISVGEKSTSAKFVGIDPKKEKKVTDLSEKIIEGNFLDAKQTVVIGLKLANNINAKVGDEVVVITQAADGSIGNDLYHISGILRTDLDEIDRMSVLFHIDDLAYLIALPAAAHEIVIKTENLELLKQTKETLIAALADQALEIKLWGELVPEIQEMLHLVDSFFAIILLIIFFVAALGVLNTTLMSVLEKTKELGIMLAIGFKPRKIVGLIICEVFFIAIISTIVGVLAAWGLDYYLVVHGWDLSNISGELSFMGVNFDPVWYSKIYVSDFIISAIGLTFASLVISLYPAIKAARTVPAKVLHDN